jgi:hypothetical protein
MSQPKDMDLTKAIDEFKNDKREGNAKFYKEAFDFGEKPSNSVITFFPSGSVKDQMKIMEELKEACNSGRVIVINGNRAHSFKIN